MNVCGSSVLAANKRSAGANATAKADEQKDSCHLGRHRRQRPPRRLVARCWCHYFTYQYVLQVIAINQSELFKYAPMRSDGMCGEMRELVSFGQ